MVNLKNFEKWIENEGTCWVGNSKNNEDESIIFMKILSFTKQQGIVRCIKKNCDLVDIILTERNLKCFYDSLEYIFNISTECFTELENIVYNRTLNNSDKFSRICIKYEFIKSLKLKGEEKLKGYLDFLKPTFDEYYSIENNLLDAIRRRINNLLIIRDDVVIGNNKFNINHIKKLEENKIVLGLNSVDIPLEDCKDLNILIFLVKYLYLI